MSREPIFVAQEKKIDSLLHSLANCLNSGKGPDLFVYPTEHPPGRGGVEQAHHDPEMGEKRSPKNCVSVPISSVYLCAVSFAVKHSYVFLERLLALTKK